jgi:hypothetical protein
VCECVCVCVLRHIYIHKRSPPCVSVFLSGVCARTHVVRPGRKPEKTWPRAQIYSGVLGRRRKKKEPKRWHLSTLDPISYLEWRKTTRKIYWREGQHTHGCLWNTARKTTSKMMFTHRQEQFAGVSISVYILYTIHAVYLYLSAVLLDTGHIWWLAPFCLHRPTWFYFINAFFTIQQPEIL